MAQSSSPNLSSHTITRAPSNSSLKSTGTISSVRTTASSLFSTTSSQKRRGILGKIGTGIESMFRRITRTRTSLTEIETQILSTVTDFSRDEILQWHEKFLTDYPNGYMTRKQLVAMYKSLCPKGDAERFARHVFRACDLDKSNTVDFREFLIGLSMTSITSSPETKLEWLFHVFDIDGNGLLTRRECLEVMESFIRFNYSLQTSPSSFNIDHIINHAKRAMMKVFDNINGKYGDKLTMPEFVQGCLSDDYLSQLFTPKESTKLTNTIDNASSN